MDKISGRAKKAAGDLIGDRSLHHQGEREERKGEAREELGREQERMEAQAERTRAKADEVDDLERGT
ncbi:MAG: CsbD family protein [Actinomycetota bacterium]|nr:CsbD family protein [Actinomycetota bacterium]